MLRNRKFAVLALLLFDAAYLTINLTAIWGAFLDESTSIGLLFMPLYYWLPCGVILSILLLITKWTPRSLRDWIALILGTPAPVIVAFVVMLSLSYNGIKPSRNLRSSNGSYSVPDKWHRDPIADRKWSIDVADGHYQVTEIGYDNRGRRKRIAYYTSEEKAVPGISPDSVDQESLAWVKNDVWTYYNPDGTVLAKETYDGTEPAQ